MSTSAHECKSYLANNAARDIANSLFQKWAVKGFFRRVSEANCPEGKRGPSGALGAAQSDPQGGWEASRATGRELCDTGHPVLEDSP